MATQRSLSRLSTLKKSRKFRDRARKESRRLHLEQLEDRRVMAVFVLPNNGALLQDGETRTVAPKDLTFRFTDIPGIDPTTIDNGIRLVRAGHDGAFGQANDVIVPVGFTGLGDNNREVVMRFAEALPDDTYQITIVGSGADPLRDTSGAAFNGGIDVTINFRLDLGAQVVAVVPQPVRRLQNGTLSMTDLFAGNPNPRSTQNVIHVYFNDDDLDLISAMQPEFYRLYITKDTLDPADDTEILPSLVEYDSVANLVRLTFGQGGITSLDQLGTPDGSRDPIKSFRLRIGTDEVRRNNGQPTPTTRLDSLDPGSSFANARDLGNAITTTSQGSSSAFAQVIEPQFYSLVWPGSNTDPGHRDIPAESHLSEGNDLLNGADDGVDNDNQIRLVDQRGIPTVHYNFQSFLGSIPDGIGGSQPAFNLITENQKQRAREIFDLYTKYSGIQFVETETSGLLIATGDLRVINPNIPTGPGGVAGLASSDGAGGGIAVMDNAEIWDDSYGANWFQVAMHEIGHLLGLGHSYDLPQITIQGDDPTLQFNSPFAEPVFPGDHDIAHMRHMFRPDSNDIDMYRFVLDGAGLFTVETFAERLPDAGQIGVNFGTLSNQFRTDSSALDTALRLYRQDPTTGVITEIARNDDYFSKDSLIQLNLEAGIYFVGVSASGNDQYDPTILDSGIGGTTQGPYEVKFDFRKTSSQTLVDATTPTGLIPDTLNVPLDGDADGNPGGVFNFWFRAAPLTPVAGRARTIFVDKAAAVGGNGLITAPYRNIDDAMAVAQEYDIVRIVGNGGADGNVTTLQDNLAYQIGFNDFTQELPDGPELTVKKNVTVMIDAGAIFQMRRSQVSVGSTAPSIFSDRSGGALQVLGTPNTSVYFTSYDQVAGQNNIGLDQNPLNIAPREGNWGGLSFRSDLDRADGRFDHEAVGVFLNYVNFADIRYGGGQVNVNSVFEVVTPINMIDRRPTVTNNRITLSADAAMSANPDSFEETNFQAPRFWPRFSWHTQYDPSAVPGTAPASSSFTLDYDRVGPEIHGNRLVDNTTNGLFVRTRTPAGNVLEEMTIAGRFNDTDIVHIIEENLVVRGTPGGATLEETPPPSSLITVNQVPVTTFGFAAGTNIEYKLTYVDLLGNEGLASASFFATASVSGTAILLQQLPDVSSPNPEFVARKLYRRTSPTAEFVLVDQIPASASEYLDRNVPPSPGAAPQTMKVLSIDVTGNTFQMAFGVNDTDGSDGIAPNPQPARNEIQHTFVPIIPGTFTLTFKGNTTPPLPRNALQDQIQNALENLPDINPGDVLVTRAGETIRIEYQGQYALQDVPPLNGMPFNPPISAFFTSGANIQRPRLDASLVIDPQIVIKSDGARIDVGIGATLLAEGFAGQEIVFTSLDDDRYGAGGTFDTNSDDGIVPTVTTLIQGGAGQNEQQVLTLPAVIIPGNFTLTFNGQTTGPISLSASAATLQTALENLSNIAPGDVSVTFAAGAWTVTFQGAFANQNVSELIAGAEFAETLPVPGDWGGIFFFADAQGSIDNAVIAYAGGLSRVEGTFAGFNAVEIHQATVRITDSKFEFNGDGQGGQAPGDRFGRGFNRPAMIFVRGAQPVIMDNTVLENAGPFININVNALNHEKVVDLGRQVELTEREPGHFENNGPLIVRNRLRDNDINGMVVRGGTLTTEGVWDDTDIVHVLFDAVNVPDFHVFGGLRLESSPTESLVVKASGPTAGITATGRPLEIDDRIGGILQVLGQPGFPVVMTGFSDDTEGAGFTPDGVPQTDTDGNGGAAGGGGLPTGPEVNNGTLIDNDVATNTVGHFEIRPGAGGISLVSGVTAQGQTQLFINQDFIFDFLNFVDVGASGAAIDLSTTTITTPPTLLSPDFVFSEGTFAGANGTVNWRVETTIANGSTRINNTLILNSAAPLGALQFINYLDEDVLAFSDDLLYRVGSPGQANFRLFTLDNAERIGFSQGGVYVPGPELVNATYTGFAADEFADLILAIQGGGTTYSPTGNIDLVDLPPFVDPALGAVNGLADVTTAMAWTVDPLATSARITSFLELVAEAPATSGTPGEWQGLIIDEFAHDRNVETVLEQEATLGDGSANAVPQQAQFIGALGPFEKGGDENLRLGITAHGLLNSNTDVDVFSFNGRTGTEVWIELDRTTHALDAVLELIDINGNVLARSNNSPAEHSGAEPLVGIARDMQKTPPFEGRDFYTTNQRDPGMRVILPGPANTTNTYFVRVRSGAGTVQVTAISEGGSFAVNQIVQGGVSPAAELIKGGPPSITEIAVGGPGGTVSVIELQKGDGVVPEAQTVTVSGGAFTLTFNGETTATIPAGASGVQVQLALEDLGNIDVGDIILVGAPVPVPGGNEYLVAFAVALGDQPEMTGAGVASNEVQRVTLQGTPTAGQFQLTFGGETTALIAFNASAADVQAALENLPSINPGDVSVVAGAVGTWDIEFLGAFAGQNQPLMTGSKNEIQLITPPAQGNFTLTFDGQTTAAISSSASAQTVQTALEALSNIAPGDVLVTSNAGGSWNVEFRGAFANQDVAAITMQRNEIQRFTLPGGANGGSFRLTFNGQSTSFIPANATAGDVTAALAALSTIGGLANVNVTGIVGGPFDVEFRGALANQDVTLITAVSNELQLLALPTAPTGGTFTLSFSGQTTAPIAVGASPATVQLALEALSNIGVGDVFVTGSAGAWRVEFRQAFAGVNVPLITSDTSNTIGGITAGAYQLQLRLREVDELGGSTVRFAKIANAVNGIAVFGQPAHSPLTGEAAEVDSATNNTFAGAQFIGNLLNSDRGARTIAGSISGVGDVDWYSFDINYDATQGIAGVSTDEDWWSTIFDIDYADGFARPNLLISVYDSLGNLVASSRDSNIADDRPNPLNGNDVADLSRGSAGGADPFIGPTELPQGRYFVAVSADNLMPQVLDQFTNPNSASPLVRLEPANHVQRIVEDHINTDGGMTGSDPLVLDFVTQNNFVPWNLHDVTLFISRDRSFAPNFADNSTQILTVDPFSGLIESTVGTFGENIGDITMHPQGRLYAYTHNTENVGLGGFADADVGNYLQINTGDASVTQIGDDGIITHEQDPANAMPAAVVANDIGGGTRVGEGVHFRAMDIGVYPGIQGIPNPAGLAVGGRDGLAGRGTDAPNILYAFIPDTGAATSIFAPNLTGNALLPGPNNGPPAGTQIVERAVLDTTIDAFPAGNADAIQVVEATFVDSVAGVTTFLILDDYPVGPLPPEIPGPPGTPNPTLFQITYGGPGTIFEFDAGPEALLTINPNQGNRQIRDAQGFFANATRVEFDTGPIINVTGTGGFANGTFLEITDVPDPGTGHAATTQRFEFNSTGTTIDPAAVLISTAGNPNPVTIANRIVAAINGQQAAQGFTTNAVILPGTTRVSLTNVASPTINPNSDSNVTSTAPGAPTVGALGVAAGSVAVRIEETSVQTDLNTAFAAVNAGTNPPGAPMPLNTQVGVSGAIGVGLVQIGFDGTRLNLSGATTIANSGLNANVFQQVNSQGGVFPAIPARVPVPFLAQDTGPQLAQRMADAVNAALAPAIPASVTPGGNFVAPGSTVQQASVPLATAAQAPGGTITGMTSVPNYDADGNIVSSNVYAVSDAGGLFQIVAPFSTNARLDYIGTSTDLLGINFSGLETGPNLVEGNRYRQMLFGITEDGTLHAFNTQGIPQLIFNSAFVGGQMVARSSMQILTANGTPLNNINGLAFSTLNRNLWQQTPNTSPTNAHRQNDDGHGIETVVDDSRRGVPGGASIHFGNGINQQTTAGIDSPGGSHGSIESELFDLTRYSSGDNPVLYFNYFIDTENVQHGPGANNGIMRDAFRVFIAGDDGVWHLLTTNDSARLPNPDDDDFDFAPLRVKDTFDDTGNWRQARVELADFAGQNNLKLRFDFSTAGSFNMGDRSTPVNGDELRAIDAIYLRDTQNFTLSAGGDTANPTRTFEFDAGFTLVARDGSATPDGAQVTIDGATFEFDNNGFFGATPIFYSVNDSSALMAQRIANAIGGVTPTQINGNRVNLRGGTPGFVTGATSVSAPGLPASFIEGAAGPALAGSILVNIHLGMSRTEVREAIALVMANVYAGGNRAQIKTFNDMIRLIGSNYPPVFPPLPAPQVFPPQFGFRFVSQSLGPNADPLNQRLLGVSDFLPGDDWGAFNSNLRGQNNIIEGIYFDDIIIGLAERGELVSGVGADNSSFTVNPNADPDNIVAGAYQLEIRKGAEIAVPTGSQTLPRLDLLPAIDTNDRLSQTRALLAPAGSSIFDGQNFTLSDGINSLTFEFVDLTIAGSGPAQGRVRIDYRPNDTAPIVAQRIRDAINSAPAQAVIKVQAQLADGVIGTNNTGNQINLLGPVSIPFTGGLNFLTFGFNTATLMEQVGDRNRFRDQGQIILQGNEIKNSANWGITIDAEPRRAVDGNSAHNGPNRNLREINVDRLVPGVVVVNNVVHNNGVGGLRISGDTTNLGVPDAPVPFVRAVNNTFYGQGGSLTGGSQTDVGIQVDQTAAPTLLNNIVANFNVGVSVDASSQGNSRTILGGMLFQGNDTNANVPIGSGFPIVLSNNQPLFVNAPTGNFYLKALSPAIDSSVDSLLDRPNLVTVRNPLGILQSPIISPDRDGVGQFRVDDPGVSTPQGFGLNPFKDRGAIDRVDFTGPTGQLVNPPDNDAGGLDLDPAPNVVVRTNDIIRDFRIRLFDRADPNGPPEGSDVDDLSVSSAKVLLETVVGATGTPLVEGVDYSFSYDSTNNLIVLTPLGGLWPLSTTYRITIDNSLATGITDRAGNPLQANQIDGTHIYTIFLGSAIDYGDAPDTYGTLAASNGPSHQVVGGVQLGATNGAEPDGQPSPGADLDPSDDGVTNIILSRGGLSSFTILATSIGIIDAWLDLDRDGDFDSPEEYIVQGFNVTTPDVDTPLSFNLSAGPQGSSYLRVRFSTTGIATPGGPAIDGEVEDYAVTMVGPPFHNGFIAEDVNNDGGVDITDLLVALNTLTYLTGQLEVFSPTAPLPVTIPPYKPGTVILDPTGGGIPGKGLFVDVVPTGGNFGQVNSQDLLAILNWLTVNFDPGGEGEGEAEGEGGSAGTSFAAAAQSPTSSSSASSGGDTSTSEGSGASALLATSLYASPSIVIEERSASSGSILDDLSWLDSGADESLELMASASPSSGAAIGTLLTLEEHSRRRIAMGPLDEDTWDDLLTDLSLDVGGLPGDLEDPS